ncbi:sigma factor-like helix-turn-helix DNA-binding protein [Nocardiopsis oceani]
MPRPVDFRLTELVPALDRTCDDLAAGALAHPILPDEWWRKLRLPLALGRVGADHIASGLADLALARWSGQALGEVMPALYVSGSEGGEEGSAGHLFLAAPLGSLADDLGDGPALGRIRDAFRTALGRIPQEHPHEPPAPSLPATALDLESPGHREYSAAGDGRSGRDLLLSSVDAWFADLGERRRAVSSRRVFTDSPDTLDTIGADFGVTRERIRQIHRQVVQDLHAWSESPSGARLGGHVAAVAEGLGAAAPVETFWSSHPEHSVAVPSLGVPLGQIVLALLPEHRVNEDWLLTGDVHDLAERLTDLLESKTALPLSEALELARECGVVPRHARAWLESQPHAHVVADSLVHWGRSLPDKAYAVLSALERPLHVDELVSHIGGDFNEAGFRDRIHNDARLMRRDRRVFGLRSWGGEEYLGVEATMRRELERAGGEMRVTELAELISGRFEVTEGSVRSLAAGSEFDRPRTGWVAVLDGPDPATNTSYRPRRGVERTRRCFRDSEGTWWLRLDLNAEHLRGSGFPVPSGFAANVGMYPGVRMPVRIDGRETTVTWKNQPLMSSIRALLLRENAAQGDLAFLTITEGEVRCRVLSPAEPATDGVLGRALRLAGIADPTPDPLAALADAVGLASQSSRTQVQRHLTDRGDGDILAVLGTDAGHG